MCDVYTTAQEQWAIQPHPDHELPHYCQCLSAQSPCHQHLLQVLWDYRLAHTALTFAVQDICSRSTCSFHEID